jgi:hypothetical protein
VLNFDFLRIGQPKSDLFKMIEKLLYHNERVELGRDPILFFSDKVLLTWSTTFNGHETVLLITENWLYLISLVH